MPWIGRVLQYYCGLGSMFSEKISMNFSFPDEDLHVHEFTGVIFIVVLCRVELYGGVEGV